jgi:beta-galactosidase
MKYCFKITSLLIISVCFILNTNAQTRTTELFNAGWNFKLDSVGNYEAQTNFTNWRKLNLPHDWSIEFSFDKESPTGTGGGALRGGVGWYTKTFDAAVADKDKVISILFEGVYCRSTVWLNGHLLGYRPNGYISFRYDITPYTLFGKKNTIVVKVNNNQQPNSRWYSGSGIYRNVWLTKTNKTFVDNWGTSVTTPQVSATSAWVNIKTAVKNYLAAQKQITIVTTVSDVNDKVVAKNKIAGITNDKEINQDITIKNPVLWNTTNPYLYKAVTKIFDGDTLLDEYQTKFGIRTFKFDIDNGFYLNNKPLKIRGVCNHHDLGCLGTAFNARAAERQLQLLKDMGCNAIRTSHNPPAPGFLDLCDKMGFLVMDEAFDMWEKGKNPFDYHNEFVEWHKKDLEDQIKRDRNHPSVIIWSVGNEVQEQWTKEGDTTVRIITDLQQIVRSLDTTRPTVTANNEVNKWSKLITANVTDLLGYNYNEKKWPTVLTDWFRKPFIVTESVSALQTRGHYDMPSDSIRRWPQRWDLPLTNGNADATCSAYENCSTPWGTTHEETLKIFEKLKHVSGMFIWTGFDYIGEPTPYDWPARSSYFGIIDLAGFPKDCYYMYQSVWTDKPVLHVLPHWNWAGKDSVDVWAYYNNADEAELFLNGKSFGTRKKQNDNLHVMWRLKYEPGNIKVVSKKSGLVVLAKEINTAENAYKIELVADRKTITADGMDLSFITVNVLDKNNNLVPDAANMVNFSVEGNGFIAGVDNGNQTSMELFKDNKHKAFNGKCLLVIQSNGKKGNITLKATSQNLKTASLIITSK